MSANKLKPAERLRYFVKASSSQLRGWLSSGSLARLGSRRSVKPGPSIVVAGASWVEPRSALVRALAAAMPGASVKAAGVRGATIRRWLPAMEAENLRGRVVLVVEMGGNGAPTREQVLAADASLRQQGAHDVIWALPPVWPVEGRTKEKRSAARQAIRAARVRAIEGAQLVATDVSADGVHLHRDAYERFGASLAAGLQSGPFVGLLIPFAMALVAWLVLS